MIVFLIACYFIAFIFLILTTYSDTLCKYRVISKAITSALFIFIGVFCAIESENIHFYLLLLPAFIFCFCGDVILAFKDSTGAKKYLIYGIGAFLLGHISFVFAWDRLAAFSSFDLILPVLCVIATYLMLKTDKMDGGKLTPYAVIYSFFVALLFSKGISLAFRSPDMGTIFILVGTALFFISDTIILFLYFHKSKRRYTTFFNLLTYYSAQLILSASILYM